MQIINSYRFPVLKAFEETIDFSIFRDVDLTELDGIPINEKRRRETEAMLLQAYEYEKLQSDSEFFEDFFSGSAHNIQSDNCRSSGKDFQLPSDSNLNKMLKHILYDDQKTFSYNFSSKSKLDNCHLPSLNATQLLTNLLKHQSNSVKTTTDRSDDPFHDAELESLNDMAELRHLYSAIGSANTVRR